MSIFCKLTSLVVVLLAISGDHEVMSQVSSIFSRLYPPPRNLSAGSLFTNIGVGEEWILLSWNAIPEADSYIIRIYSQDNILQREIQNVQISLYNVTGLDDGTRYSATVSAIYITSSERRIESAESDRVRFSTKYRCRGGQVFSSCSAHCVHTCKVPDPICDRRCVAGCACPRSAVIFHEGSCIIPPLCPSSGVSVQSVTEVEVLQITDTDILLVWDPISGAKEYNIKVTLNSDRNHILRTLQSTIPFISITGLTTGETYAFIITVPVKSTPGEIAERSSFFPPTGVRITNVQTDGFRVSWDLVTNAARYAVALLDEDRTTILYENKTVASNSLTFENLVPGWIYFVKVAAARLGRTFGPYSHPVGVRTRREDDTSTHVSSLVIARLEIITTTPLTTTPTTRPTTTPIASLCRQRYLSEINYNQMSPENPIFPLSNCDENGLFVTKVCLSNNLNKCRCIDRFTGKLLRGSDLPASNSEFPLNCDRYGDLNNVALNLRVRYTDATSVQIGWDFVSGTDKYVVIMQDGNLPPVVLILANTFLSYTFEELIAGNRITFGIYVINGEGWSSAIDTIDVFTKLVEKPTDVKVIEMTDNRVTVTWKFGSTTEYFNIRLLSESDEVVQTREQITENKITFTELDTGRTYKIEIRAVAERSDPTDNSKIMVHKSEPAVITVVIKCSLPLLDVIFVIDASSEANREGFRMARHLFAATSLSLPLVELNRTRIAVVRYYKSTQTMFSYNRFETTSDVVARMSLLPYGGGPLYTGRMLNYIRSTYFTEPTLAFAKRPEATSVVIIFSGGTSQDFMFKAADSLKLVTNIISVGVEGISNEAELTALASRSDLKITTSSFDNLWQARDRILKALCHLK